MDPFRLRSRRKPHQCAVEGCRSQAPGPGKGTICRRCRERRYKALHPYTYALNKLRNNARRRGIEFDLSLEEFVMFCDLTGYATACGRQADDLSIDRIDNTRGYTLDNIRAITVRQNRRKQEIDKKVDRLRRLRDAVERALKKLTQHEQTHLRAN